jgi:Ca2+-binding RTX toxin-like protein
MKLLAAVAASLGVMLGLPAAAGAMDFSVQQNVEIGSYLYGVDPTGATDYVEFGVDESNRYWSITSTTGIGQVPAHCFRFGPITIHCDPLVTLVVVVETGAGKDRVYSRDSAPPNDVDDENGNPIYLGGDDPLFRAALGPGNDRFRGGSGQNLILGEGGRDKMKGGANGDVMIGGPGRDRLDGRYGPDLLVGGPGADFLRGGPDGGDVMLGGGGRDRCAGGYGDKVGKCERVRVKKF